MKITLVYNPTSDKARKVYFESGGTIDREELGIELNVSDMVILALMLGKTDGATNHPLGLRRAA